MSLLPNVLAKQRAVEAGAYEAWLVDDAGMVTEGTASNAWIVTARRRAGHPHRPTARSSPASPAASLLRLAAEHGLRLVERPFSLDEAKQAREAFLTSTTSWVKAVVRIDDVPIGGRHRRAADRPAARLVRRAM